MKDLLLLASAAAIMIFGYFVMNRLGAFLEESRKNARQEILRKNEKKLTCELVQNLLAPGPDSAVSSGKSIKNKI